MINERRNRDQNRTISPVSLLLCFAGLLAIAFSITMREIQTTGLPQQLALMNLTPSIFNKLNATSEHSLIITLILSGLIVDLIGPRTVLSIAVAFSIVANYFFSTADYVHTLFACRLLSEYSHIFILMSVLTLGSHWLPRRHFAFFSGLLFGILLMAPILVIGPLLSITTSLGIESMNAPMTLVGLIIIFLIVKTRPIQDMTRRRTDIYGHFNPLRYYKIWLIGIVAMIGWMTNTFLLGVGLYYLTWEIHFTVYQAMTAINVAYVYFIVGVIVLGIISDFFEKKRILIAMSYCIAAIAFTIIIFVHGISTQWVLWLLYATAFFAGSNIICYTKANDYCTVENSGIALGLVLSVSTIGSSLFSKGVHYYLRQYIYTDPAASDHNWKMIVMTVPISLLLGALISLFLRHDSIYPVRKTINTIP